MRRGVYAVVDGIEYEAKINRGTVSLFMYKIDERPEGWGRAGANRWYRVVETSEVGDAFRVITTAMLDDVEVWVEEVDPVAETSIVRARHPPYSSINDQRKPPPHLLLEAVPNPPYSVDWMGIIPWDRLTDVKELSGPIDATTGEWLDSEAT